MLLALQFIHYIYMFRILIENVIIQTGFCQWIEESVLFTS